MTRTILSVLLICGTACWVFGEDGGIESLVPAILSRDPQVHAAAVEIFARGIDPISGWNHVADALGQPGIGNVDRELLSDALAASLVFHLGNAVFPDSLSLTNSKFEMPVRTALLSSASTIMEILQRRFASELWPKRLGILYLMAQNKDLSIPIVKTIQAALQDDSAEVRLAALCLAKRFNKTTQEVKDAAWKCLFDSPFQVGLSAADYLERWTEHATDDDLMNELKEYRTLPKEMKGLALAELGLSAGRSKVILGELVSEMNGLPQRDLLRRDVLFWIVHIGREKCADHQDFLLKLTADDDASIRLMALKALSICNRKLPIESQQSIKSHLFDAQAPIQAATLELIPLVPNADDLREHMLGLLTDDSKKKSEEVTRSAVLTISTLAPSPRLVPALLAALRSPDYITRIYAERELRRIVMSPTPSRPPKPPDQ